MQYWLLQLAKLVVVDLATGLVKFLMNWWNEAKAEKERRDAQKKAIQNMEAAKTEKEEKEAFTNFIKKT